MTLPRRRFLKALSASLAVPGLTMAGRARSVPASGLDDPAVNLRAFVKLTGALDEAPVFDLIRGSVYALVPGRPAQLLFRTLGAGLATYTQESALEYRSTSRYVGLLLDWDDESLLEEWDNPLNGVRCTVPVTRYGPGGSRVLPGRILPEGFTAESSGSEIWPWFSIGDVAHMQRTVLQESVPHPLFPKADLMTYSGSGQQLTDDKVLRMASRLNFSAVESWRPWMRMGEADPTGTLWWHVAGAKLNSADDYPEDIRKLLLQVAPGFFDL